jgi:hypothetical protein
VRTVSPFVSINATVVGSKQAKDGEDDAEEAAEEPVEADA